MTLTTHRDPAPATRPRRPATRRWIRWIGPLLIGSTAVLAACSTPGASEPTPDPDPVAGDATSAEPGEPAAETPAAATPGSGTRRRGQSLESQELVGLGELGLLPSLLQTFSGGIHCDFDDALSTCQ